MTAEQRREHWNSVFVTKEPSERSWTQPIPRISLEIIHGFSLRKDARIIDIGGGDSRLVDYLLEEGFQDITVLDISGEALRRVQERLGGKASGVHWIVGDITEFSPERTYDLWHDRATFHFLTTEPEIEGYLEAARRALGEGGLLTVGTFSTEGPKNCSGLEIRQYSEESLEEQFKRGFRKLRCLREVHMTPFHTTQNFNFCSFMRLVNAAVTPSRGT